MSNIQENLQKILSAVWGRDVRQAIHDAIHDCYEDSTSGTTDLPARERIDALEANSATKTELQTETTARTNADNSILNIIGSSSMGTTAVTIKGAIAELLGKINTNTTNISSNLTKINNNINKIGSVAMGTTATTLTGAIKELKTAITNLQTHDNGQGISLVNVNLGTFYFENTGAVEKTINVASHIPSGYSLIGVIPNITGTYSAYFYSCALRNGVSVWFQIMRAANYYTSATTCSPTVTLICKKNL